MHTESSERRAYRLPASFLQEGFFYSMEDGMSNYNMAVAWRFTGTLEREVVHEAISALIARHEALRTTLVCSDRGVDQLIWPSAPCALAEIDLADSLRSERYQLPRIMRADAARPFDLRHGNLVRATLITLSCTDHVLLLAFHHAVSDAWSTKVMLRDLQRLYAAIGGNRSRSMPELRIQFGDYAAWERTFQDERCEAYWRQNLRAPRPRLRLPIDLPWTIGDGFVQAPESVPSVSPAIVRSLTRLAKNRGASFGTALRAAVASALLPYAPGEVIIGDVYANRGRPELHPVVGCLFDYVPLRIDLSDDPTFIDVIERVRDVSRRAHLHLMPFGAVQQLLGSAADERLFDVTVNYFPYSPSTMINIGTRNRPLRVADFPTMDDTRGVSADRDFAGTELLCYTLTVDDRGGCHGFLWANEKAFARVTVRQLGQDLARVLRRVSVHPERRIGSLVT